MPSPLHRFKKELLLFMGAIALVGFGESIVNSTLNNFLHDSYAITSLQRTFLELPRELPGFMVVFISTAMFFLRSRRLAVFASLLGSLGFLLIALFPETLNILFIWIFLYSAGQHLLIPLTSIIAMEMAHKGQDGRRLGQVNSIRNTATVVGSFVVFVGFKYFHFTFQISFFIAAGLYLLAALFFYRMHPGTSHPPSDRLQLRKEYGLYYWLVILFGTRKQIFMTFAPWVLVTVYHQSTSAVATLLFAGGLAGILFQPILGRAIDQLGEKVLFIAEAIALIFVCLGYGYAKDLLPNSAALMLVSVCFVADQLLMSVNMARATFLKKIVKNPNHLTSTLMMGTTLDHMFSIVVALVGGLIWVNFGYQFVFLFGGIMATLSLISSQFVQIPAQKKGTHDAVVLEED